MIDESRVVAEMAAVEKAQEMKNMNHVFLSLPSNWIGKYPILYLPHALIDHDKL